MKLAQSIVMLALEGIRGEGGRLLIGGEVFDGFPEQVVVEGMQFELSEEEEVSSESGYTLGHYVAKGPASR